MKTLYFCGGCTLILTKQDLKEQRCPNCDASLEDKIPGQFTCEDASRLETAATDQTQ